VIGLLPVNHSEVWYNLKRGLVTMCAAGGMAPAIIIERV
jgi:acetyl-CoA acetyltransferase